MAVTKRHMVIDSGSTSSAAGTCSVPTGIHEKRCTVTSRADWFNSKMNVTTEQAKLTRTAPVARAPTCFSLIRLPFSITRRKPARGMSSINVAKCAISALHLGQFVHGRRRATSKDRHDNAQPHRHLGGGDHHDEEDNGLSPDVAQRAREGHEGQVDRVEHQLDAHEHDQRAAAGQQTEGADTEEQRGEDQVPGGGDVHASTSLWVRSRRANRTAPTTAMINRAAVASKAKR